MNKTTKESLIEEFERDRDGTKYYSLSEKEMGNLISQAHTAGRKEALEGVLEIAEKYFGGLLEGESRFYSATDANEAVKDFLTDIKNKLTE